MRLHSFHINNFRRLKDVRIDLESTTSIFVGSNNSGKTSATHIFKYFLGSSKERFSVHDFSADCWAIFNNIGSSGLSTEKALPTISLDLWFEVKGNDFYRVINLLPSLTWSGVLIGVRMEFAPKDTATLLTNFDKAKSKVSKFADPKQDRNEGFHPWPETLTDYLKRRLNDEYKIFYYVLDHNEFDENFKVKPGYTPQELGDATETGGNIIKSLLKVDFLDAPRHMSDTESADLSKLFSRFYERNLQKHDDDFEAVRSLAKSEAELNKHLSSVFEPTLKNLNTLGYPGFAEPHLVIKSAFNPESILTNNTNVHYALRDPGKPVAIEQHLTLPGKYNGLGFKSLIYMVIQILDFHKRWAYEEEDRPPLHLIMIEEPEAHLHVQLQQVFIQKVREILPDESPLFTSQLIVTTHSPHIIYESSFNPIRYFRRINHTESGNYSDVLNLSNFCKTEKDTRDFLLQYMKLTHCDLFFADAAILVEGNVERLLLPLMIEQVDKQLQSCYLSILELGGAFAHLFKDLIQFLGLTTLVITDLDSVAPRPGKSSKSEDGTATESEENETVNDKDEEDEDGGSAACMVDTPNAVTSNQTLIQWLPKLEKISDLLSATADLKSPAPTDAEPAKVCVAFQTRQSVIWNNEKAVLAGRTFEEAFAYENLNWCQDLKQRPLHLRVVTKSTSPSLTEVVRKIHERVKGSGFNKTDFALALMMKDTSEWVVPSYISEGLRWLSKQLIPIAGEPSVAPVAAAKMGAVQ